MYRAKGLNRSCNLCPLSYTKCIHGQSEVPLFDVKLIVVSAYPGNMEIKTDTSLAPNPKQLNAGGYIRAALSSVFDGDTDLLMYRPFVDHIFFTNALKCPPSKSDKSVEYNHIRTCSKWLNLEISQIPSDVPILIAGSEAVKSLLGIKASVYSMRGQELLVNSHPAIITMNPIEPLRYHPNKVVSFTKKKGGVVPSNVQMEVPLVGSVPYFFKKDLVKVKNMVKRYVAS